MNADSALNEMLARVRRDAQRAAGEDVSLVANQSGVVRLEEEARAYAAQHDYSAAHVALARLVLSRPNDVSYILEMAASHQRLGRYQRALIYYDAALGLAPAPSMYYHAAICHLALDAPDAAADLLTAGLARAVQAGIKDDNTDPNCMIGRMQALLTALNDPYQDNSAPDR